MNTLAELENKLMAELTTWNRQQCQNIYEDYYLYYLATTSEYDGVILICTQQSVPPRYELAMAERINKGATIAQNFNSIRLGVLRRLPVLTRQ